MALYKVNNNSSSPVLSLHTTVSDIMPVNPGKPSKLQLRLPNSEDRLILFYNVDSVKETALTRPQSVAEARVAPVNSHNFSLRLL